MLERSRLKSKKISKTESVQSQLDERLDAQNIHIGPSDYVPWQHDNKVCFIRMEGRGFGGRADRVGVAPVGAGFPEQRRRRDRCDPLREAGAGARRSRSAGGTSAYYMKSPPRQLRDSVAREACNAFIDGRHFDLPEEAARDKKAAVRPGRHSGDRESRARRLGRFGRLGAQA